MDIISLLGFAALVIVGIALILFVLKIVWMLVPAAIVAVIVFFLTLSLLWTGMAFLIVAILTVVFKLIR